MTFTWQKPEDVELINENFYLVQLSGTVYYMMWAYDSGFVTERTYESGRIIKLSAAEAVCGPILPCPESPPAGVLHGSGEDK